MCALLLENAETHLGQPEVQQHFLIHLQQMNLEDEFVIASVQSAHCHLREGGEARRGLFKHSTTSSCHTTFNPRHRGTCLLQASLYPSVRHSQASFSAANDASALTVVKKRVILRTSRCHVD